MPEFKPLSSESAISSDNPPSLNPELQPHTLPVKHIPGGHPHLPQMKNLKNVKPYNRTHTGTRQEGPPEANCYKKPMITRGPSCRLAAFPQSGTPTPHPSREVYSGRAPPPPSNESHRVIYNSSFLTNKSSLESHRVLYNYTFCDFAETCEK